MAINIDIKADVTGVEQGIQSVSKSLSNLKPVSAQATSSLNALSQVARDAPFGFIAIQNNLPILFDQFGALTKSSGGVVGAFKSIGDALDGPAGVTFAIGAVISGITFLVQKYGSIGNAIDTFIGKTISATDIQNKYNDSLDDTKKASAGEIANLNSLVSVLTNVNSTRQQQVGAFDEINKKYPALLTNIKLENIGTSDSIQLIKTRTELIGKQIILEGRREALIKLIGEAALDGEKALAKFTNRDKLGFFDKLGLELRGLFAGVGGLGAINILNADLGNAVVQTEEYSSILKNVNDELAGVNGEINTIIANYKKQQKAVSDQIALDEKSAKNAIKNAKLKASTSEKERQANLKDVQDRIKGIDVENKLLKKGIEDRRKTQREVGIVTPEVLPTTPPMLINEAEIKRQAAVANEALNSIKQQANFADATTLMQNTFFNPLTDLFDNFIQTGRFAFKDFANAVLKAISQIVAKIIATGIIVLLASILFPGAGGIGATFGANIGSAITSAIGIGGGGFGGGGRVAAPSFSGVQGGSMQMAGAVNLQLRGTDLVGAINRTNATINRVG